MSTSTQECEQPPVEANVSQRLNFADQHIDAQWVQNVSGLSLSKKDRTIVVNTGTERVLYRKNREGNGPRQGFILPWRSTILEDVTIVSATSLVLLRVLQTRDIGGIISTDRWVHTSTLFPGFPAQTPLWRSLQHEINKVTVDAEAFATQGGSQRQAETFQVKVNLWFAPGDTDCRIHNQHTFLEVHTQVHGIGRMQKFYTESESTQYEDVILSPGITHDPFMEIAPDGSFIYPWHRYISDTDCIWMAIELHRA